MCTAKSRLLLLLLLRPVTLAAFLLSIENMRSAYTKGPQVCRLSILALALTLFVGASPVVGADTFTVTNTADTLRAGSLRAAIIAANANPGADVINLRAGTYVLTISGTDDDAAAGDLDITGDLTIRGRRRATNDLTIRGRRAATTIIDARKIRDRVFHVIAAKVKFSGVTISHGSAPGDGGGIRNDGGTVEFHHSTISGSTAIDAGGGIFNNSSGTVTLIYSAVRDNSARFDGGGIRNDGGTVKLFKSTVDGNKTNDCGGGIRNNGGMLTLTKSTVSGNTAADPDGLLSNFGGGIFNNNGGTLTLTNSTVSDNTAAHQGGGMRNEEGSTVTLNNSTITANTAEARGGGMRNLGAVNFQNTIIAGNKAGTGRDCSSSASTGTLTSLGYNLVGAGTGCDFMAATGDQVGTSAVPIDPLLGSLQDNGGPTSTHALLAGSPAIDAGNPAGCTDDTGAPLTTDQRGVRRPLGVACDIGAYEQGRKPIALDIKSGSDRNAINPRSKGVIPVAILTTDTFDAKSVDPSTVRFGPSGAGIGHRSVHLRDVDKDGDLDLVLHFRTHESGIVCDDTSATLIGATFDGTRIKGSDSIVTVGCKLDRRFLGNKKQLSN